VEEADGLDYLENLQQHEQIHIYEAAYKIVEEFFSDEDEGEGEENGVPAEFGASQNGDSTNGNGQPMFQF
jgi:importin subunit alpha-6/7